MSHTLSDASLVSINSETVPPEIRKLLNDQEAGPSETRDQAITAAIRSLREQLEHATSRRGEQDIPQSIPQSNSGPDQLQELLQRLAILRSPVTRLPPEILSYIFDIYVSSGIESGSAHIPLRTPSRLVQVCKLWRSIAQSDPFLWTSFHLYFPDSHSARIDDAPKVGPILDLHLKRSGALPISFTFIDHRPYHSVAESLISLLVDRLRAHAHRWKQISLHLSCAYFPLLFTFTPCDLSSLEHIHINGDVLVGQRAVTPLRLNLESAINLKSLAYSGPGHSLDERLDLHWENLAEASFEYDVHDGQSFTLSRQFRHLSQCQNLTTLSLGIGDRFWRPPNGGQPLVLPCVETLRIRRHSPQSNAQTGIIPLILVPQLKVLEIDASRLVHWNEHWHNHTFSSLLRRSSCSLRHLSIRDVDFPNDELLRCLNLSPTLTSLRFIPCPRSQNISDIICRLNVSPAVMGGQAWGDRSGRAEDGPLVPQLRDITLATSVEAHLGLIMEMLCSRAGAPARAAGGVTLRRAEVIFFDMWHHKPDVHPASRSQKVAGVRAELARRLTANGEDGDTLEASVLVDSPYLPGYINV